jgi:hypothetical protein
VNIKGARDKLKESHTLLRKMVEIGGSCLDSGKDLEKAFLWFPSKTDIKALEDSLCRCPSIQDSSKPCANGAKETNRRKRYVPAGETVQSHQSRKKPTTCRSFKIVVFHIFHLLLRFLLHEQAQRQLLSRLLFSRLALSSLAGSSGVYAKMVTGAGGFHGLQALLI